MVRRFACLSNFTGVPITEDLIGELNLLASQMVLRNTGKIRVKTDSCEGELTTKFETFCMGAFVGIRVDGTLESDNGKGDLSFLVMPSMEIEDSYLLGVQDGQYDFRPVSTMN